MLLILGCGSTIDSWTSFKECVISSLKPCVDFPSGLSKSPCFDFGAKAVLTPVCASDGIVIGCMCNFLHGSPKEGGNLW